MAYRLDYGHVFDYADFLVRDCLKDKLNGLFVGGAGAFDFGLVALGLVGDAFASCAIWMASSRVGANANANGWFGSRGAWGRDRK